MFFALRKCLLSKRGASVGVPPPPCREVGRFSVSIPALVGNLTRCIHTRLADPSCLVVPCSPLPGVFVHRVALQEDGSSFEEGMLKLLRTLPKVLKYLPSDKAKDARNFMMSFQVCRLEGVNISLKVLENVEFLVSLLLRAKEACAYSLR